MENKNTAKTVDLVKELEQEFDIEDSVKQKEEEDLIKQLELEEYLQMLDIEDVSPEEEEENSDILLNAA